MKINLQHLVPEVAHEPPAISIIKATDTQGQPCVGVVLSQNAFVETIEHDLYPGVALNPEAAQQVIEKMQGVLREIAAGSETITGFFKLTFNKTDEPKKD
jgi:hypothetical protein